MTKGKDKRERLEICDWRHELPVTVQSKGTHYSAKSKARDIMTELDIGRKLGIDPGLVTDILDMAREFIRNGYDVQLCRGIHLYVCVDRLKTPFIAAKTMGAFRKSVSDKAIRPSRNGESITQAAAVKMNEDRKSDFKGVTPDTVIKCWRCGAVNRVGRRLVDG